MPDADDIFQIQTNEQLRAISDELRQRIVHTLNRRPMTVTQVGEALDIAPAKIHYHVRELERVGLVKLVETREKGGILEKYYSPIARDIQVSPTFFDSIPDDQGIAAIGHALGEVTHSFMRAFAHGMRERKVHPGRFALLRTHVFVTDDEFRHIASELTAVLAPFEEPRGIDGEQERTVVSIVYDTRAAQADDEEDELGTVQADDAPEPALATPNQRVIVAGALHYDRPFFESLAVKHQRVDISVLGILTIADDVPAELVDRTVASFRHRGPLRTSPAVRDVLKTKSAVS